MPDIATGPYNQRQIVLSLKIIRFEDIFCLIVRQDTGALNRPCCRRETWNL